jgi:hypothetical protein
MFVNDLQQCNFCHSTANDKLFKSVSKIFLNCSNSNNTAILILTIILKMYK